MAGRVWAEVVAGAHNAAALAATRRLGRAVVRGNAGGVLLLHGPPGVGKTLLVTALVRRVARHPRGLSARTSPARELVSAYGEDDRSEWGDWLDCDLLAVEDLQHLPGRGAGPLCQLLDARQSRRRPTLFTCREGPARFGDWPARLASRLAAGLVVRVAMPDEVARRELVRRHAERRKLRLAPDAVALLAARPSGVRELLGHLETLRALEPNPQLPLDAGRVAKLLGPVGKADAGRWIQRVAEAFGLPVKELLGPSRRRSAVRARQAGMYLLRDAAGWSLPRVAAAFGRDHTTVLHAVRKVTAALPADAELAQAVAELRGEFGVRT